MKFEFQGEQIKKLAKKNKITITELAEKLGVTRQTIHNWITGNEPKASQYLMMCEIFNKRDILFVKKI